MSAALCMLTLMLQPSPTTIPLWPAGAPGYESRRNDAEQSKDWWVKNIHNPSVTVYLPPKGKASGTAVLIAPGGGFRELVYDAEGRDAALFLNTLGVTAFALKYRLPLEEGSPYKYPDHPQQDAYRAMRLIRSRAAEWGVKPDRIGVLGFSAGGMLAAMIAYPKGDGDPKAADPIDRLNGRPNFQMLVYPGPYPLPTPLPKDTPPTFLVVANDDDLAPVSLDLYKRFMEAKVPVEAHFFAKGNHAFNMGYRSDLASIKGWPQRMADWLKDSGYLK